MSISGQSEHSSGAASAWEPGRSADVLDSRWRETNASHGPMLTLRPDRIDLWFAFIDEILDERILDDYRELLSASELTHTLSFHFPEDQRRFLITRALVRTVLSHYAKTSPARWSFVQNRYGRPEVAPETAGDKRISFNVSHTKGLIMLGVTCDYEIGVDTEKIRARNALLDVAEYYFAAEEVLAMQTLPVNRRSERFYQLWTLKESYIKARGMGLSIPLDQVSFSFPRDKHLSLASHPGLGDDTAGWRFWQVRPGQDYLAAICVKRPSGGQCPELTMRRVVPLESEEEVAYPIVRTSS
jgi:4'-phosphopantetheinyl transferase